MNGMDIKFSRIRAGLKGYELAAKLGITPEKLSRIENGRLVPSPELLKKIREELRFR